MADRYTQSGLAYVVFQRQKRPGGQWMHDLTSCCGAEIPFNASDAMGRYPAEIIKCPKCGDDVYTPQPLTPA